MIAALIKGSGSALTSKENVILTVTWTGKDERGRGHARKGEDVRGKK